ncbi:MAG: radical SAM protein [Patescibacteria group bacterium]
MKVLILNPPVKNHEKFIREGRCEQRASSFQYLMVPISLPSIAALLREKGFEVKVIDSMAEELDFIEAIDAIEKFNPRFIITNFSTATYPTDKDFTFELKKAIPKIHITAIGVHVTSLPGETLRETALDSVIRGEPEITTLELAEAIAQRKNLKRIKGLSYRSNPAIVHNPDREFIADLNILPFPARDLLKNERYKMPVYNRPYTLVVTARGCPNNCSFCTASLYYGTKIRYRKISSVLDEVEEIIKIHHINDITFWADTFTFDRDYVLAICQGIKERGLKFRWMANARVDRVDLELLNIMRKSGCQIISYGVESGVQKILNNIGKNITLKEIRQAFLWTRQAGIESAAHIIFGLPGETEETIRKTIKFVLALNPDYVQFYSAIPFPGTRFYHQALENGWLVASSWQDFEVGKNVISTPELSLPQLAKWRKRAYLQFYLRPAYIFSKMKKFIHQPRDFWPFIKQAVSFLKDWAEK